MLTDAPAVLRELLAKPGLLRAPGVFEGLGAHLVRRAGFSAAYLTGAGVAVSGYGNAANVVRTVRAYERAGVAAIQLEDQAFPKRCGHLTGKELVSADEFARKLHAALDAREADTVIIARTDARGPAGIDEAITRAKRYAAEGADLIFVEAPESRDEIERVAAEADAALVFNVVPSGRSPEIDEDDLERLGYKLAIYPGALLGPVVSAMATSLAGLGGRPAAEVVGPGGVFGLVGLREWTELDERYQ